jgi:hypothetical protein
MFLLSLDEIAQLDATSGPIVFLHRRKCPFSRTLYNELKVASSDTSVVTLRCIDLGRLSPELLDDTWLPGTPCFVHTGDVHLGIDAFAKCRDLIRSVDGVRLIEEPT